MKKLLLYLFFLVQIFCANAKDHEGIVTENLNYGGFTLISQSKPVGVIVAENDKKGVLIAVQNLQKDFERVCGKQAQLEISCHAKECNRTSEWWASHWHPVPSPCGTSEIPPG